MTTTPFALLPGIIVFGVLATIAVPLFAFVSLVVVLVVVFVAVVATGWGLAGIVRCRPSAVVAPAAGRRAKRPSATDPTPYDRKEAS